MKSAAALAHRQLKRVLVRTAEREGLIITPTDESVRRWASATFEGGEHTIKVQGRSSEQLLGWLAALDEDSVRLPDFGASPDAVVEALNKYVQEQLQDLGEPDADWAGGEEG